MAQESQWTVLRLLEWTTGYLREHGSQSPRLDAEVLLAHCRGTSRIDLYTAFQEVAEEPLRTQFRQLVRRRAEGCPVAYLVGSREFFSRRFRVTADVLIPRPETEFVITALLDRARRPPAPGAPGRLADIGTGSGNLAITACLELPGLQAMATDLSPQALAVARQNAVDLGVADRIQLVQSDLFAMVPTTERFDYVVSNPPYVGENEFAQLPRDVRDHEPAAALLAGPTGISVIERLIPQAAAHLNPAGWLIMEISPMIHDAVMQRVGEHGGYEAIELVRDLAKRPRVIVARRVAGPP